MNGLRAGLADSGNASNEDRVEARTWSVGIGLFLLGTITAAIYTFVIYPRQGSVDAVIDLNGFGKLARHIVAGDGFSLGYGPTLRRAPLYPAIVALMLRIFGSNGPDADVYRPIQIFQCGLLGLTCVTSWTIGRRMFTPRAGMFAGVLCAFTPQTLRYVPMTEVETTMGLLIALSALTGLNLIKKPNVANGVLFGLIVGAAALVKPVALLYAPVFAIVVGTRWLLSRRRGYTALNEETASPFTALAVSLMVFAMCLAPWSVRNAIVTHGEFKGISSNAPGEFLRGYVNAQPKFALLHQDFGGSDPGAKQWDWEANLTEDALLRQHGMSFFSEERFGPHGEKQPMEARMDLELAKDKIEGAEVMRRLTQEPGGFVRKFAMQVPMFWYVVETRKKSMIVGAIAAVALLLAGVGWLRALRYGIDVLPVALVVLYYNLVYAAILAFARYSMPVYPTLLVLTAFGLTRARQANISAGT